jgi:mRNA interferase MazF
MGGDPVTARTVRGQIVEVDLDPVVGHEQGRLRPCVVVQNDVSNRFASTTIIVPLTDARNISDPSPIYVAAPKGDGGLKKDSLVLCDQIRTVDQQRFGRFFGVLSPETMTAVDRALSISLGLARGGKA